MQITAHRFAVQNRIYLTQERRYLRNPTTGCGELGEGRLLLIPQCFTKGRSILAVSKSLVLGTQFAILKKHPCIVFFSLLLCLNQKQQTNLVHQLFNVAKTFIFPHSSVSCQDQHFSQNAKLFKTQQYKRIALKACLSLSILIFQNMPHSSSDRLR